MGFQIDAAKMAISANQKATKRASTNHIAAQDLSVLNLISAYPEYLECVSQILIFMIR